MTILITGATGLIGRQLTASFTSEGDDIRALSREPDRARSILGPGVDVMRWLPGEEDVPSAALDGVDTVFHLMGEPVGGRWTKAKIDRIVESRIVSATKLAAALKGRHCRFISASSFGIYKGERGAVYDESQPLLPPQTQIQAILQSLERAVAAAEAPETRINIVRFGMVCAAEGYPKKLTRLFKRGTGFIVGDGEQIVPIVDADDAVGMLRWVAAGQAGEGVVNCVAPSLPTFSQVARAISTYAGTALRLSIPAWLARPLLGGSADYFLLSYNMRPAKALDRGYNFRRSDPEQILRRAILGAQG